LHPAFKRTFHAGWYINIAAIAALRNDASASDSVKVQFLLIQTKAKLSNIQFCSCVKAFIECHGNVSNFPESQSLHASSPKPDSAMDRTRAVCGRPRPGAPNRRGKQVFGPMTGSIMWDRVMMLILIYRRGGLR
jgi:hypothetical protein